MSRPENQMPPYQYYNQDESLKYTNCSRIINVQSQLTERALELLNIDNTIDLVLDIGCGSGLSGEILQEHGLNWIGLDISESMLQVAQQRKVEGELVLSDVGQGFRFRPGVFDAAISISAIQWLCVSYAKSENPFKRLRAFFESLKNSLKNEGRAVFQFYPENNEQLNMISNAALKAGFSGNIVIDYPNSAKAKKIYLVLQLGGKDQTIGLMEGLKDEQSQQKHMPKVKKNIVKSKKWIIKRKQKQERLGKKFKATTKYTGRRRNNLGLFK